MVLGTGRLFHHVWYHDRACRGTHPHTPRTYETDLDYTDWYAMHGMALDRRYDGQVHPDDLDMVKDRLWDKCVGQETAQWGDGAGVGADALLGGDSSG